ncbi:MAG: hypothetical protein LBE12_14990 [Planctomycetaceae bacterium]|jgi:hypothetical protein|nr:hypothetical protein [Planctomycetaceae bacterium]
MFNHYHFQLYHYRLLRNERGGLSTIAALAVLAIVGSTVMLLAQTMIREQHDNARKQQIIQANILTDDWLRIAEKRQQDISVTIPASELYGIADFRLTAETGSETIVSTGEYIADEHSVNKHSVNKHYSTQKRKLKQK